MRVEEREIGADLLGSAVAVKRALDTEERVAVAVLVAVRLVVAVRVGRIAFIYRARPPSAIPTETSWIGGPAVAYFATASPASKTSQRIFAKNST